MSTNSILSKIRQEIERYEAGAQSAYNPHDEYADFFYGKVIACEDLLSILDTLSEEPTKSLDEAAEGYTQKMLESWRFDSTGCRPPRESFKAGAEWQASQMPMPEDTVLFQEGVAEGRRLEREGMLKDAVGGMVCATITNQVAISFFSPLPKELKAGDKVRIVVLKEEE